MRKLTALLMCFCWVGTHAQNNIGSGNCLDFSANINNANHLSVGALSAINTQDFTIECWMKVNSVFDDEAFFSNKNWSSSKVHVGSPISRCAKYLKHNSIFKFCRICTS